MAMNNLAEKKILKRQNLDFSAFITFLWMTSTDTCLKVWNCQCCRQFIAKKHSINKRK